MESILANWNLPDKTWEVLDQHHRDPDVLLRSQISSYDNFIRLFIPQLFQTPIVVTSKNNARTLKLQFLNVGISRPTQYVNRLGNRPLLPKTARDLNYSYSARIYADIEITDTDAGGQILSKQIEARVLVCRIPAMVHSSVCHLHGRSPAELVALGECPYDRGGYFIVNGGDKAIISQERPADNTVYVFPEADPNKTYTSRVEIKSSLDQRYYPIKTTIIRLGKDGQLYIFLPHGRSPIPLAILFKAMGVCDERRIIEYILDPTDPQYLADLNIVTDTVAAAREVLSEADAVRFISNSINVNIDPKDAGVNTTTNNPDFDPQTFRLYYAKNLLNRDLLPHEGVEPDSKLKFLGMMVRQLLLAERTGKFTDRDKLTNKRLNLPGPMLAQIYRHWFSVMLSAVRSHFVKTVGSTDNNRASDIRKIIESSNLTKKLQNALSTGNWYTTRSQANSAAKKGVAQAVQRGLSYNSSLSLMRRVSSPLEHSGSKHEPPRRLHGSQINKICPNETPEGAQVGTVKNLAFLAQVTNEFSADPALNCLTHLGVVAIEALSGLEANRWATRVLVNGRLVGALATAADTYRVYRALRYCKRTGIINKYAGISWDYERGILKIQTDGGRYVSPYWVIDEDNWPTVYGWWAGAQQTGLDISKYGLDQYADAAERELANQTEWYVSPANAIALPLNFNWAREGVLEYLDTDEEESSMIASSLEYLYAAMCFRVVERTGAYQAYLTKSVLADDDEELMAKIEEELADNVKPIFRSSVQSIRYLASTRLTEITVHPDLNETQRYVITNLNRLISGCYTRYTHMNLHPSMCLGVVSAMIPFSDHNPSPRNCYQCVADWTPVLMADGRYKAIKDIKVGDEVVTIDPGSLRDTTARVIDQYVKETDKPIVQIILINGKQLVCTDDHPILVRRSAVGRPIWLPAGSLTPNDLVVVYHDLSPTSVRVRSVLPHARVIIADITIDAESHSFVTGDGLVVHNSSMGKQAIGVYASNYHLRWDTMACILLYPGTPISRSRLEKYTALNVLKHGNTVITVKGTFLGYNQEDSAVSNKHSADRGLFNNTYYRTYTAERSMTQGDTAELFEMPPVEGTIGRKVGANGQNRYHAIVPSLRKGRYPDLPALGAIVEGGDVIIPMCKKIPRNSGGGGGGDRDNFHYKDNSVTVRPSEGGVIDRVIPSDDYPQHEDENGNQLIKVRVCALRAPEIADKFASRAAQKGTIGIQLNTADMAFTAQGVSAEHVMNPHGIPSRMTLGQLLEAKNAKLGIITGRFMDATPFTAYDEAKVTAELQQSGYDYSGDEFMYNGLNGDMIGVISVTPTYYQKLKHMVADKIHARATGPVQSLTKQPAEGRSRNGGLRLGEMERDALVAYGATLTQYEKFMPSSDGEKFYLSKKFGVPVAANPRLGIYQHGNLEVYEDGIATVQMPYSMELLRKELNQAGISMTYTQTE
jgi:DNA-directed RNA polymerase beta subunit